MTCALQGLIVERGRRTPDQPYLCQPIDRQWHTWTWSEALSESRRMAAALVAAGLQPGDRVGLVSKNCAHWIMADMALILAGLVSVPVYPTASARTLRGVLEHSGAKACFIGKLETPEAQLPGVPDGMTTIAFPYPGARADHGWDDFIAGYSDDFRTVPRAEDDLATLLYTSGSTGEPKGAMHTFASFNYVGAQLVAALGTRPGDRIFSYLPLSHCTERAYVEATSFRAESTLYFAETLETFMADLAHARPTMFGSVPRLWKRFQLGVLREVPVDKLERMLRIPLMRSLIKRRIKRGLGLDRADWFASGSAPIAPSLLAWWHRLGVPISEGWGMTETFAYGTQIGRGVKPKFGTISKPLPDVDMIPADDGEILVRCACMMTGYYRDPDLTAASFTDEGYFRTGDRGTIDADGWVRITGRVKEVFKTAKGKYVAPVPLESLLAQNALIELACVVGSGMTQPVVLVQLPEDLEVDRETVAAGLEQTLQHVNAELEPHERIARIVVVREAWTIDNGLLTPTLKIRRAEIEERYTRLLRTAAGTVAFE